MNEDNIVQVKEVEVAVLSREGKPKENVSVLQTFNNPGGELSSGELGYEHKMHKKRAWKLDEGTKWLRNCKGPHSGKHDP